MDFYVSVEEEGFYDQEIISMGGKIHHGIVKAKGPIKSFNTLRKTVKNEKYDYVLRTSQHSLATIDLIAAKLGGARKLVYRSSNSNISGSLISRIIHILFSWLPKIVPTVKIAPSTEAAEFVFGKGCVQKNKVILLNNGIKIADYIFDPKERMKIREELGINDKLVIGHVGRFSYQKNHIFLLDIFKEIIKKEPNSILLLVGKGELENKLKSKIEELGLEDKVILTGVRQDVPKLMMAMDSLVFPSFYEGMPNTIIEAQATGLFCVIADTITKEAQITNDITYVSLDELPEVWAEIVLKNIRERNRVEAINQIKEKNMILMILLENLRG